MLQIVTRMYFREDVPLHSTVHRAVLFTNRSFLAREVVDLPVGEITPSTLVAPVSTVTLSVTEHLEADLPDGQPSHHVATSGTELLDDLADVLSFGLNSVFSRNGDLVRRLVPESLQHTSRGSPSSLFKDTFDPHRYVPDTELNEFRRLFADLVAMRRSNFEAAMRAIKRLTHAVQRAVDNPSIAYVDLVAALESLSEGIHAPAFDWTRLDGRKRKLIDDALVNADEALAARVRNAVLEAERAGAKQRFVAFVLDHVGSGYFREEAVEVVRPVRGAELERAVKLAYDLRSRNVHALVDLPSEVWLLGGRVDTVSPVQLDDTMLSLDGLARLARHVVKTYIDRAPKEIDHTFLWRDSLPGKLLMRPAPQYWLWNAAGFSLDSVGRYFSGFIAHLTEVRAGRADGLPDMTPVLERIESLLPSTTRESARILMVAIYAIWHRVIEESAKRPQKAGLLNTHIHLLGAPGMPAFVTGYWMDGIPDWTIEQWETLAAERRSERAKRRQLQVPAGFDAALQAITAEQLLEAGRRDDARARAQVAVEELPGTPALMQWEATFGTSEPYVLDLDLIILGTSPDRTAGDHEPPGGEATASPPEDPQKGTAGQDVADVANRPDSDEPQPQC